MKISRQQLVNLLTQRKGTFAITIETDTEVKMRKTGNPFVGARKLASVNGIAGFIYENSVNKQREREGSEANFESESRTWGHRVQGTPLVSHNDKLYLELKVERALDTNYMFEGQPISKEELKPFLPVKKISEKQETEKPVILCDYSLDNIKKVRMFGEEYEVE